MNDQEKHCRKRNPGMINVGGCGTVCDDGCAIDQAPTTVVTVSNASGNAFSLPAGYVAVKETDLKNWVAKMKEANAFRDMVSDDALFIETAVAEVLKIFGTDDLKKLTDNPLTALSKIGRLVNNVDKLGIDVDRFKVIAEKYRAKQPVQIEQPKTETDGN
jgi:hypothetical protein